MDRAIARAIHASPLFAGTRFDESAVRTETFRKGRLLDDMRGSCACVGLVIEGTIDDLARYLGISRSALFRQIARLKEEGVVCSHGRALRLCRAPCPPRSNETH